MNKKRIIAMVISYSLFAIFFGMSLFFGIRISRSFRNMKYYNNEVFPLYGTSDSNSPTNYRDDDFLKETISSFNALYSRKTIYEYKQESYSFDLVINLKIYPFYRRSANDGVGYVIHIDRLEYLGQDLMKRTRLSPAPSEYYIAEPIYVEFSFTDESKITGYKKIVLDPFKINYFTNSDLGNTKDSPNELTGIRFYNKEDETLLIICNEKSSFYKNYSISKRTDLDLSESKYNLGINYNNLTNDDILNHDIYDKKVNYGVYQNYITITIVVIVLVFLLVGYFAFAHGYLVRYIKNKKGIYN